MYGTEVVSLFFLSVTKQKEGTMKRNLEVIFTPCAYELLLMPEETTNAVGDIKITCLLHEAEKTRKPVFVVTECSNGRLIEKLEWRNLGTADKPQIVLASTKVIFRSLNRKSEMKFHNLLPSGNAFMMNSRYNLTFLNWDLAEYNRTGRRNFFEVTLEHQSQPGQWLKLIVYSDLSELGNKISLLHEINHSHRGARFIDHLGELEDALVADYEQAEADIQDNLRSDQPVDDEVMYSLQIHDEQPEDTVFRPVPREDFLAYHQTAARDEKMAWNSALYHLREARKRGLDLEPELPTNDDLDLFIHHERSFGLGAYEALLEKCQGGLDSKKVRGIYSQKMYKFRRVERILSQKRES